MIFSLWSIFLYYWQNIITCGFLSFFQANKGVCGFWGEIVHITWKTWPCAHCAVVEVDTEQDGSLGICEIYQCWAGCLSFPLWLLSSWCSCEVKSFECVKLAILSQPNFRKWQGNYLCKKSYLAGILFWPRSATPAAISLAMWPIQKRFVLKGNVYPIKSAKRVECRLLLLVTWTLSYQW